MICLCVLKVSLTPVNQPHNLMVFYSCLQRTCWARMQFWSGTVMARERASFWNNWSRLLNGWNKLKKVCALQNAHCCLTDVLDFQFHFKLFLEITPAGFHLRFSKGEALGITEAGLICHMHVNTASWPTAACNTNQISKSLIQRNEIWDFSTLSDCLVASLNPWQSG